MNPFALLLSLGAMVALCFGTQACEPLVNAEVSRDTALSRDFAGSLVLRRGQQYFLLEADCYEAPAAWSNSTIHMLVNNYLTSQESEEPGDRALSVQVLKLTFRAADAEDASFVKAFRSTSSTWYRDGKPIGNYEANDTKLDIDPSRWSSEHHQFVLGNIGRNDLYLGGRFHAQAAKDGPNSFRTWWRINNRILVGYDLGLNNFLFKFQPATGEIAGGIDFRVRPQKADGLVVRYDSQETLIEGLVRICFGACGALEQLPIEDGRSGGSAGLFGLFRSRPS